MSGLAISETALKGVLLLAPRRSGDQRGWFSETFRAENLSAWGIDRPFIQDNEAYTARRFAFRGLHFQAPPKAQAKLVRVTQGSILDIAVDIRSRSSTYGRHIAVQLNADSGLQMYIPAGFAHGYLTLSENTVVSYKVDTYYAPSHEGGLAWNDPALNISWPEAAEVQAGARDSQWPTLAELNTPF